MDLDYQVVLNGGLLLFVLQVDADPDVLPRTDNFGLNYMAFVELCDEDTVPDFLRLTFNCCIVSHFIIFNSLDFTHCCIGSYLLFQSSS